MKREKSLKRFMRCCDSIKNSFVLLFCEMGLKAARKCEHRQTKLHNTAAVNINLTHDTGGAGPGIRGSSKIRTQ